MIFSNQFKKDLWLTWQAIGFDAIDMCEDNDHALEFCIDADRIETFGSKESNEELHRAIQKYGYDKVHKHLSKEFRLL